MLKGNPEMLARAELAMEMGRAPRVLEGWAPSATITGNKIVFEPEFDKRETEILMAVKEIRADRCPGCGGYLSETTEADHFYTVHEKTCQRCRTITVYNEAKDKEYQHTKGTELESVPAARRLWLEKKPLPPPEPDGDDLGK